MCSKQQRVKTRGFTLIEIIVTIVVLSIASTSLMSVFTSTVRTSANPMVQLQALSIAEAYMEEILLKEFDDPDLEENESRGNYDDVQDYNQLADKPPKDQNNQDIGQLLDYEVTVVVFGEALGPETKEISSVDSMRIDITVSHPAINPVKVTGYRTNY
jgi:MSHA pilin protein MshD